MPASCQPTCHSLAAWQPYAVSSHRSSLMSKRPGLPRHRLVLLGRRWRSYIRYRFPRRQAGFSPSQRSQCYRVLALSRASSPSHLRSPAALVRECRIREEEVPSSTPRLGLSFCGRSQGFRGFTWLVPYRPPYSIRPGGDCERASAAPPTELADALRSCAGWRLACKSLAPPPTLSQPKPLNSAVCGSPSVCERHTTRTKPPHLDPAWLDNPCLMSQGNSRFHFGLHCPPAASALEALVK